jgi:hypothetical protein
MTLRTRISAKIFSTDKKGGRRMFTQRTLKSRMSRQTCGWLLFLFSSIAMASGQIGFQATPLTEYQPGQMYLAAFPGLLYDGSNVPPSDHDADGRIAAAQIRPLNSKGHPSAKGKIVVVGIGMSNWTIELCTGAPSRSQCNQQSFMSLASSNLLVNKQSLVIVDCAIPRQVAKTWVDDTSLNYSACQNTLEGLGLTESQVQVVLYKDANASPKQSLTSTTACSTDFTTDACVYERYLGETARYLKKRYRNIQQIFLHSRIYAGYAEPGSLNPEPFAYEYGFSTKWFINAQISQIRSGVVDPVAGDLSYHVAPWISWGPYFWASGGTTRQDGLTWIPSDYKPDMTHPAASGASKVAHLMLQFYLDSPYSPWFRQ